MCTKFFPLEMRSSGSTINNKLCVVCMQVNFVIRFMVHNAINSPPQCFHMSLSGREIASVRAP